MLNHGSHANVDSALLEDSQGGVGQNEDDDDMENDPDKKESEDRTTTTNNLQQIKVPMLPKNENDVDFLTEGSVADSNKGEYRSTVR